MSLMRSTCLRMRACVCARISGPMPGMSNISAERLMMLSGFFRSWTMAWAKRPMSGEAFGLDELAQMHLVEFAESVADLLQQAERQRGECSMKRKHFAARKKINFRVGRSAAAVAERGRSSMTAISPKISPGPSREKTRRSLPLTGRYFHQPVFDEINAVAGLRLPENFLDRREISVPERWIAKPADRQG